MKQWSNEDINKALNLAYFYLKFRLRTKKEIVDYLHKKSKKHKFPQEVIEKVIKELEEEGLIDDKKFIKWFVESRGKSKPKSQFVLKGELLRFGVNRDLIDQYFENQPLEEETLAVKALESRWYRFQNLSSRDRFQKSAQFLMRRGFSFDVIKKATEKLIGE